MNAEYKPMKERLLRLINHISETVLAPIRPCLIVFYAITRLFFFTSRCVYYLSNEFLKSRMSRCGESVRIHGRITVTDIKQLSVGDNVHINENAFLRTEGGLHIGSNTHISRNLLVYTINHRYEGSSLPYDHHFHHKPVTIGENVWIGMNVTIIPGVTIGEGSILGMGSVVTTDIEPLSIVGGNPAKVIKTRNPDHYYRLKEQRKFSGMSGFSNN